MLRFEEVTKVYRGLIRRTPALRGLTMEVASGEIVGLVGANGAGKTTAILLALGYLRADVGRVEVLGGAAGSVGTRSGIGWVPDEPIFHRGATGAALLDDWLAGHGRSATERRRRVRELLERFGIAHAADRRISTYSLGMQQKVSLALALSHEPRLLILDEPFSALDHRAVVEIQRTLEEFRERGGAVLVSSHHLAELERICNRALFLAHGSLRKQETVDGVGRGARLIVGVANPEEARALLESECPEALTDWSVDRRRIEGRLARRDDVSDLVGFLVSRGIRVESVEDRSARLEEIFLEMERG